MSKIKFILTLLLGAVLYSVFGSVLSMMFALLGGALILFVFNVVKSNASKIKVDGASYA